MFGICFHDYENVGYVYKPKLMDWDVSLQRWVDYYNGKVCYQNKICLKCGKLIDNIKKAKELGQMILEAKEISKHRKAKAEKLFILKYKN